MNKLKRALTVLLLAGIAMISTGCSISLFSSEHKHYHHDKCEKQCKEKCKTESKARE